MVVRHGARLLPRLQSALSALWLARAAKQEVMAEAAGAPLAAFLTLLGALLVSFHLLRQCHRKCMKRRHGSGYAYSKTPRIGDEDAFLTFMRQTEKDILLLLQRNTAGEAKQIVAGNV